MSSNRNALKPLSINSLLNSPLPDALSEVKDNGKPEATKATTKKSAKRAAPADFEVQGNGMSEEEAKYLVEDELVNKNCNQVRTQIRTFIEAGGMKIGEFQKAIGVSAGSYSMFMSKNGPKAGNTSTCYYEAWAFFRRRELMGLKMPKKSKTIAKSTASVGVNGGTTASEKSPEVPGAQALSHIVLPGEESDSVPIFDTCDDVRRKITAHLCKPGVTAAQFCRDMSAMFCVAPKKIMASSLTDFRNKKGPKAGNTSSVFYGAYVYFEKKRIFEGKPKSKKREEMEVIYATQGGMDTKNIRHAVWAHKDERVTEDQFGQIHIY